MVALARTVHVDPTIHDYVSRLVDATRTAREVRLGVSVRGALALIRASKTHAAGRGRHYVVPDDVKALADRCSRTVSSSTPRPSSTGSRRRT